MAIVNGKKLYNSRKLAAIAAVDDRAAAEYSWMMAGTGDDWGRYEANPRVILGTAYKLRPGVTEADIARWLKLYDEVRVAGDEHGLVRLYVVDGVTYAEWTNYTGDSESQRRYHNCPEPPWSKHEHRGTCRMWGAAKKGPGPGGAPAHIKKIPVGGTPNTDDEKGQDGDVNDSEQGPSQSEAADEVSGEGTPKAYTPEPSVLSVPSVPPVTDSTTTARAREDGSAGEIAGDRKPAASIAGSGSAHLPPEERRRWESEGNTLIAHIRGATREDETEILATASTGNGRYTGGRKVTWASMSDERVMNTVIDLRERWRKVRPPEEDPFQAPCPTPATDPAAEAVWAPIYAHLESTISRWSFGTWFRPLVAYSLNGEHLRVWVPNEQFERWLKLNYINPVRDAAQAVGQHHLRIEFGVFRDHVSDAEGAIA